MQSAMQRAVMAATASQPRKPADICGGSVAVQSPDVQESLHHGCKELRLGHARTRAAHYRALKDTQVPGRASRAVHRRGGQRRVPLSQLRSL